MPVLENYYEHLYHGPVVSLRGYCAHHRLQGSILAYLDFGGATGSAKDGLAEGMLALAAEQGLLAKGQPIVEASSGTFAVALTIAARHSGHPVTLTMPEGVPDERKKLLRSLGAQLAFSSPLDGRRGAERLARELAETQNGYYTNYFANDLNPEYHRRVTGPNILKETDSQLDAVVIGVGSGGTITGVGEYLRAWENTVKVVAVEPYESQAIGGGFPGRHGIAGLGAGFVPENYNPLCGGPGDGRKHRRSPARGRRGGAHRRCSRRCKRRGRAGRRPPAGGKGRGLPPAVCVLWPPQPGVKSLGLSSLQPAVAEMPTAVGCADSPLALY